MSNKYYKEYLKQYGRHFTKELCEFAVSLMENENGPIIPYDKADIDTKLQSVGIKLVYNKMYDYIYVANMCKADFLGNVIAEDDLHLCKYIKAVIDDPDGYDGQVFNRWISDMEGMRIPIDWSEFI